MSCTVCVVVIRSSKLTSMISPVISYIEVAYICVNKGHHTGTNQVFNGCAPNSVQAVLGVIIRTVRHGVCLQESYLVKRENNMGTPR